MKLVYQYMVIYFNFKTTSNHLHPLQVENCNSNLRLVVDEDDYGKFRLERVNLYPANFTYLNFQPLEVVSRYRDPQPQVVENYPYLFNLRPKICKSLCLSSHFIHNNSDLTR